MKKTITRIFLLVIAGAGALPPTRGAAADPEPPRPSARLDAFQKLEGRWACAGEAPAGPMGPGRRYRSTFRYTRGLGGFFWLSEYEQLGGEGAPPGLAARGFLRWEKEGYRFEGFLSNGATAGEAVTFDGRTYVGSGEMRAGGQAMNLRETIRLDGERKLTWTGELRLGKDYVVIGRDSCERE